MEVILMSELIDTFSNRLKIAMRIRNIKASELSAKTGIAKSSLSEYIKGKYEAKQDGVFLLAKALDVNEAWLMGCNVPMERNDDLLKKIGAIPLSDIETTKIPVLGTVKAGYDYLAEENIIDYISFQVDGADKENYYALNVIGDSMTPLFDNGDTVIVHKQDDFDNGDNCVVLINGDEATIKKVYRGNTGIELKAINPYYPPRIFTKEEIKDLPVKIIGVVEKSIRNFKK
jgi:repressor LexA